MARTARIAAAGPRFGERLAMIRTLATVAAAALALSSAACQSSVASPVRAPQASADQDVAAPGCVRIQRGVRGDVADTRIAARWPDASYGDEMVAFSGHAGSSDRHMLVGFDLGSIPKNAIIARAALTLQKTAGMGSELAVHRVTKQWAERTATYRGLESGWDRTPEQVTQLASDDESNGRVTLDVTAAVGGWVSGEEANHGLLLSADDGTAFATSEATDAQDRPRLEICFSLPGA
jgi:hypothetical protein